MSVVFDMEPVASPHLLAAQVAIPLDEIVDVEVKRRTDQYRMLENCAMMPWLTEVGSKESSWLGLTERLRPFLVELWHKYCYELLRATR